MSEMSVAVTHNGHGGHKKNGNSLFTPTEPVSSVSMLPPRLIFRQVDVSSLPKMDRMFYEKDSERSRRFVSCEALRRAYVLKHPCMVLKFRCMDEKEADTEANLGIPLGASNSIEIAGNLIGEGNLKVAQELQMRVDRAVALKKLVFALFITHESGHPNDSCAAWSHDIVQNDAHAKMQVERLNHDYVDRDPDDRITRRYLIAVHIKSVTDTESRIWCGSAGCVDPMHYVGLEEEALPQTVNHAFRLAFPSDDSRFIGMTTEQWSDVLDQMTGMCIHNIGVVRAIIGKHHHQRKSGHKGTRLLIGRGWKMYNEVNRWFRVSDLSPDEVLKKQVAIACKYLFRNDMLKILRRNLRRGPMLALHVNVPYNQDRPGDRSGSIRQAMGMARFVKAELISLMTDPVRRKTFDAELRHSFKDEGVSWGDIPGHARKAYQLDALARLRLYISVSARETCAIELVATSSDL